MGKPEWTENRLFVELLELVRELYPASGYHAAVKNLSKITINDVRAAGLYYRMRKSCGNFTGLKIQIAKWIREEGGGSSEVNVDWDDLKEFLMLPPYDVNSELNRTGFESLKERNIEEAALRQKISIIASRLPKEKMEKIQQTAIDDMLDKEVPLMGKALDEERVIRKHIKNIILWKMQNKDKTFADLSLTTDRDVQGVQSLYRMIQRNAYVISVAKGVAMSFIEEGCDWDVKNGGDLLSLDESDEQELLTMIDSWKRYH